MEDFIKEVKDLMKLKLVAKLREQELKIPEMIIKANKENLKIIRGICDRMVGILRGYLEDPNVKEEHDKIRLAIRELSSMHLKRENKNAVAYMANIKLVLQEIKLY